MIPPWAVNWLRLTFWSVTYLTVFLLAILAAMSPPWPMPARWTTLAVLILGIVLDARQKSASSPSQR